MDTNSLFDGYRVLLADESRTRLQLFEKWLPEIATRTATSIEEFSTQLDSRTAVTTVPRSLFGDHETTIRREILSRNPHCQLILMLPHGASGGFASEDYDACLRRPVHQTELQSTIETQLKYGVYSHTLHEFYTLNAELWGYGRIETEPEKTGPQHREKMERYQALKARLDELQTLIDTPDIDALLHSLKRRNQHLTEPVKDAERTQDSKYHPDRCPHCKLPWGVDHRNKLGTGLERVGAYVWRCNRCNEIAHGRGNSHRRVLG